MAARSSVVVTLSSDESRLLAGLQRVLDKERQLEAKRKEAAAAGDKVSKNAEGNAGKITKGLGAQITQIAGLTAKYLTLGAAVGVAKQAMQAYVQEQQEAIAGVRGLDEARRNITQVSVGDRAEIVARSEAFAGLLGGGGGAQEGRRRALELSFIARSFDIEELAPQLAKFDPVVRAESAAAAGGKIPQLFPGAGLTPGQAIAMQQIGASRSEVTFERFVGPLAQASKGAQAVGATPEETIAALTVLSKVFASPERAATKISTFGLKAEEAGLSGGLGGALASIQAMSPTERKDFMKSNMELRIAVSDLTTHMAAITAEAKEQTSRGRLGLEAILGPLLQERMDAGILPGQIEADTAEARRLQKQEEELAAKGFTNEAAVSRLRTDAPNPLARFTATQGARAAQAAGAGELGTEVAGGLGRGVAELVIFGPIIGAARELTTTFKQARDELKALFGSGDANFRAEGAVPQE